MSGPGPRDNKDQNMNVLSYIDNRESINKMTFNWKVKIGLLLTGGHRYLVIDLYIRILGRRKQQNLGRFYLSKCTFKRNVKLTTKNRWWFVVGFLIRKLRGVFDIFCMDRTQTCGITGSRWLGGSLEEKFWLMSKTFLGSPSLSITLDTLDNLGEINTKYFDGTWIVFGVS